MAETISNPPDPERIVEGLRDTGYQFETALADIIDNSIAAHAKHVSVSISMDYDGVVRITIADDGIGMDREGLILAMRYGSPARPDPMSLGKFGMGLKTASTAFCRKLSVVSRPSSSAPTLKATLDLDSIGDWNLVLDDPLELEIEELSLVAGGGAGTLVVWEKVDRLLKSYAQPGGTHARKALKKYVDQVIEHVAMIYQRFLDTADDRAADVEISINGSPVEAWDPFLRGHAELVAEDEPIVELNNGANAEFTIRAFVLPRRDEFQQKKHADDAKISNRWQGIYIYRENRLIHGPDWLRLFSKEPHGTLLRVEFSFDHRLDDAFHVDIKKSQILLNEELYGWVAQFLTAPRRAANEHYRTGMRRQAKKKAEGAHDSSNNRVRSKEEEIGGPLVQPIPGGNEVDITNREGEFRIKIRKTDPNKPGETFIQPTDSINDGLLWEPALVSGHRAVRINTSHPYYHKVYVPNLNQNVLVQGMDSLLWALSIAELSTCTDAVQRHFVELRAEVSRILRHLVDDLPDPVLEETDAA